MTAGLFCIGVVTLTRDLAGLESDRSQASSRWLNARNPRPRACPHPKNASERGATNLAIESRQLVELPAVNGRRRGLEGAVRWGPRRQRQSFGRSCRRSDRPAGCLSRPVAAIS